MFRTGGEPQSCAKSGLGWVISPYSNSYHNGYRSYNSPYLGGQLLYEGMTQGIRLSGLGVVAC